MGWNAAEVTRFLGRNSKRIVVSVVGGILLLGGIAMLVLPGPGIVVVAIGFAVLGTEYAWAASAFDRTKKSVGQARTRARAGMRSLRRRTGRRGG